jgi:rhodanese-related sulfurtransferase
MGKKIFYSLFVLFLALFSGCIGQNSNQKSGSSDQLIPQKITRAELAERIQDGGDVLLIDVRTEGEYVEGHLPGAIVIPYDEFDLRYNEILEYKGREVVLYCHVGGMGDFAGRVLLKNGFTNVKNLEGGIYGWINSGGKIV